MNNKIQGFEYVYMDKRSPRTLLLLHGTGGDEHDLLPLGEDLDPKANLLSPRGQVLENGSNRFFKRLAEGVFDQEDLQSRSKELGEFILEASKTYGFPKEGVIAVGYSNGANIALRLLTLDKDFLMVAVLLRPMSAAIAENPADLHGKHVLVTSGKLDQMVPEGDAQKIEQTLAEHGANVDVQLFPAGHSLTPKDLEYAKSWLSKIATNS